MCREERVYYVLALFAWDNFVKILEVSTIAKDQTQVNEKIRAKITFNWPRWRTNWR